VGSDNIRTKVTDLNNGNYTINFLISWPGTYSLNVILNDVFYSQNTLTAVSPYCPNEKPTYCANSKTCVEGTYLDCGLSNYVCADSSKPL